MIRSLRVLSLGFALVCTLTFLIAAYAQEASPAGRIADRITDRVDDSRLVTLKGGIHPLARPAYDRGPVAPDLSMGDLFLVLRRAPDVQAAFDQFVASQYDPTSPNFHQWLTADEIGQRFGSSSADIQTLSNWLQSHGFHVDEISRDRVSIRFSGTAAQVQSAFHTEIHTLNVKGIAHIANLTDAQIPVALAPVVVGVRGLHNFFPRPLHRLGNRVTRNSQTGTWQRAPSTRPRTDFGLLSSGSPGRPKPLFGTTDSYGDVIEDVTPYDFAAIYNVLPLWQQSTPIDGTGQSIAIAGTSNIVLSDVADFRKAFGLPTGAAANTPTVIVTNSDPGACPTFADSCSGDLIENTLDVEWSGAVAKGASIVLVTSSAPTASTDPLYLSESYIVQNKTAPVMNVSYGDCEVALGYTGNVQYNTLWQTAAAEGISVVVATGDGGSADCDQDLDATYGVPYAAQFGRTVSGIASTPYDTAVGGTDLNWGSTASPYWSASNNTTTGASALGYIPEVPWNSTCVNPLILPALQSDATYISASPVTDAESACNFVLNNYSAIYTDYGVQLAGLVDTVGGGGGASNCTDPDETGVIESCTGSYAKPSWQAGVAGIPSDGVRDIPDVSFFASNGFLGSAYLICVSGGGSVCTYSATSEPSALEVGGTSVASPAMAGVLALINQRVGAAQGNPDSTLYTLAAAQTYSACSTETAKAGGSCFFNDIDTGTIAMPCGNGSTNDCIVLYPQDEVGILSGYASSTGFDLATGLGSLNVANVVNKWPLASSPLVSLSPSSLTFPSTAQGYSSATETVTLQNTGKSALTLSGVAFTGADPTSFSQTDNCGASVAANASCTVAITFKPTTTGTLTASLSLADNAYNSPQTVALSGIATAPAPTASLSANSINFGNTAVGATNSTSVTLTNTGTAALSITSIGFTGTNASSFSQTNACGSTLAVSATCSIGITFKPTVAGNLAATFTVADNAANSPQTIALTGTATGSSGPTLSVTPGTLTFASTAIGTTTAAQQITITNTGTTPVTFSASSTISGSGAGSFLKTASTCTNPLPAGASCTNSIEFKPTTSGALTAIISYPDNATGSPQTVTLNGTGAPAGPTLSVTPGTLTFASTAIGSTTAAQLITITNTGATPVTFSASSTISGTNASSFLKTASTCTNPLPAGASCTNSIEFKPTTSGALTAIISYPDNATGSPQTVTLNGTGAPAGPSLSVTPGTLTFASTAIGTTTAAQQITITNTGATPVTFSASSTISGTNASSFLKTASTCTNPLPAGASCTNSIEFKPTTSGALTAIISYPDNATGSPQTVTLNGTGAPAGPTLSVTPGTLTFVSTAIGSTTAAQLITITNTGATPVTFSASSTISGTNASSFLKTASTCTNPLPAGASCTNSIEFKPTTSGALTAIISYPDNATGSPQTVILNGTGH